MITAGRIAPSAYSQRINRGFQARQPDVLLFAAPAVGDGVAQRQIFGGMARDQLCLSGAPASDHIRA